MKQNHEQVLNIPIIFSIVVLFQNFINTNNKRKYLMFMKKIYENVKKYTDYTIMQVVLLQNLKAINANHKQI